jgi:hypothetical protein
MARRLLHGVLLLILVATLLSACGLTDRFTSAVTPTPTPAGSEGPSGCGGTGEITVDLSPIPLQPANIVLQLAWEGGLTRPEVTYAFGNVPEFTLLADGSAYYVDPPEFDQRQTMVAHLMPAESQELVQRVLDLGFERLESYADSCQSLPDGSCQCVADAGTSILRVRLPGGELREIRNYADFANNPAVLTAIRTLLTEYRHPQAEPYQPEKAALFLRPAPSSSDFPVLDWPLPPAWLVGGTGDFSCVRVLAGADLGSLLAVTGRNLGDSYVRAGDQVYSLYLVPWLPGVDYTELVASSGQACLPPLSTPTPTPVVLSGARVPTPTPLPSTLGTSSTMSVLTVSAYIDGRSQLILQGDAVHWHHLDFAAPGRLEGADNPTYLNWAAWYPAWPDSPDAENRDCNCDSSAYVGLQPLAMQDQIASLEIVRARDRVAIVQQPDAANAYTLIIEFDDGAPAGATWYEVDVSYLSGGKPTGIPVAPGPTVTPTPWPTPAPACTFGGPYEPDEHTLLLLHLDGTYTGAQGEVGATYKTEFAAGRHGQGLLMDGTDVLTFAAAGNLSDTQGAVEFWLRPNWNGDDGGNHTLFWWGDGAGRLHLRKDAISNLVFDYFYQGGGCGSPTNVAAWRAGEWHHVAFSWQGVEIRLYVDGRQVDRTVCGGIAHPGAAIFYVGSGPDGSDSVDATVDELRISDVPRVGNSDVCSTAGSQTGAPAWQPQSPTLSPSPRCCMGFVYDSVRNVTIAVGGGNWTQVSNETWEYDGTTWTLRQDLPQPAPVRWTAAVAYNPDDQVTVLFGGKDQTTFYNDTWLYDGRTWAKIDAFTPPSPRNGAKMAYDGNRQRMVLFGGYYGPDNVFFDETWEYEDGRWTQRFPTHHPEARESSALVYDARRGVMVLFGGGRAAGSTVYGDTWEWDGNDWIQRLDLPACPPARWAHTMTYDGFRQRTILFGGLAGTTAAFDDTWEYDGQTWTQVTASPRPSARWDPGLAYDLLHGRAVLFGGMDWDGLFGWSGDTWHYAAP